MNDNDGYEEVLGLVWPKAEADGTCFSSVISRYGEGINEVLRERRRKERKISFLFTCRFRF